MKYIELVKGLFTADHEARAKQADPYVAYSMEADKFMFNLPPESATYDPYVTFKAEEANSMISLGRISPNQTLEYSTDKTTWNIFDISTRITLANVGDEVYVRGVLSSDNAISKYTHFNMTGKIAASGNCNAIWNYQDLNAPLKAYCGYCMFQNCPSLINVPDLPATTLADKCYSYMFANCTSLIKAPALPATVLTYSCYNDMFYDCESLITAPALPATELVDNCYSYMFSGCTNLNHITCLATNISAKNCLAYWVVGVSSTGTFVKHPDTNGWSTDYHGIPSGWTVVDAEL